MAPGAGIYVHIPYCRSKCAYCNFNSYPTSAGVPDGYVCALVRQAELHARMWEGVTFTSVYFGGGTPSMLGRDQLERIVHAIRANYDVAPDAEFTLESNPNSVDEHALSGFRHLGVNRLSIGIQTTDRGELAVLGRTHTRRDALKTLEMARAAGLADVNVDIIVGIPGQTRDTLTRTLSDVLSHACHISAYLLSVEPNTELARMVAAGEVELPDDDRVLLLYACAHEVLVRCGFERYEISNWCLHGRACVHNLTYWQRGDYLGLGAGAHSHRGGVRYALRRQPSAYMAAVSCGTDAVEMHEILTDEQMLLEEIMLGLRTAGGICPGDLAGRYMVDERRLTALLDDLAEAGYVAKEGMFLQLTPRGICLHDSICDALADAVLCPECAFQ